ncbi:MAG: hypothetical protein KAV87_65385 [Desulfobacteraceae bacterium]|nr:hypothetical protein [Desulfobacteraceae bacterium]
MKSLMDICRNFENEGCRIDINTPTPGHHSKTEEEIPMCPEKKELDKICRNCKFFYPKECPNCNSTDIKEHITGVEFKGKETITNLSFICENCGGEFFGLTYIITKKQIFK